MTTLSLFDEPPLSIDVLGGQSVRELPATDRAVRAGGLTLPVLAFAALVASPAIWQCLVRHTVPMHVMLERYVVIALGCLLVSEVARRLLRPGSEETVDETVVETVVEAHEATAEPVQQ